MVKKPAPKSEQRQREARASFRMHDDLREAVEFIARAERRTLSQVIEIIVIDRVRDLLKNEFGDDGRMVRRGDLEFKPGKDPRR